LQLLIDFQKIKIKSHAKLELSRKTFINMKKKHKKTQQAKSKSKATAEISPSRKRLFTLIMLLIPLFLLALLEAGLQLFEYGGNTDLFVSIPHATSEYYGINRNVCKRYFASEFFNPTPRKDLFLKEKPNNCYRIFVLGGSTTAGFPYGNNLTFTRILNRRLSDTFPDRRIEVVNTAFTAINSFSLSDFMDEILEQQPDALLIYAGHNEFYGALGVGSVESLGKIRWLAKTYLKLQRFKTIRLLRDTIGLVRRRTGGSTNVDLMNDPMATEMSRIVKEQNIPLGSNLYELGKEQFRHNLHDIFKKAKDAGIPVLISDLVSNIRDQQPFVSVKQDTFPSARTIFEAARILEKEGRYDQARRAYYRAKDLDALRFRASEEFNEIIHRLAGEFKIPVVPMKSYFEATSPHGLVGFNLIHEHLHPNIDGYFLMADAFYNTMRQQNFISPDWLSQNIKPISYYRQNWGFTRLDSVYAVLTIAHLKGGWPFKRTGPNLALDQFTPITKEDTLAINILKRGESTLELGHLELAQYYENRGELERAFQEYKALIYIVPNLDLFYEPTLKFLLTTEQYEHALQVLEEALKYNESFFIYKWIGQIHLVINQTQQGISFLEKARNMVPDDAQLLYNLTRAYYNIAQFKRGDEIMVRFKKISPSASAIAELEALKKSISNH
jgi:tetratricopeptide (TPR) repeat protein